jgi:hypothetical protein
MKRCIPLLVALALPMLALAADPAPVDPAKPPSAPAQPPAPPDFGWLADLVGSCWSATLPGGSLHTQCYSRQYDKFVRGVTTLSHEVDGAMRTVFAGDSVFAADARRRLVYYTWGSDGSHRVLEARYEGDQIVFPFPAPRATPPLPGSRSVWKRIDKDSFEVRREKPGEDGKSWVEEVKVVYHRSAKAESKGK